MEKRSFKSELPSGIVIVGAAVLFAACEVILIQHPRQRRVLKEDTSYQRVSVAGDVEHRCQRTPPHEFVDSVELSGLEGMPKNYKEAMCAYTRDILEAINTTSFTRKRYYDEHIPGSAVYPHTSNPVYDCDSVVPIVLFPRPEAVVEWSVSTAGRVVDCLPSFESFESRRSILGRTLLYEMGPRSEVPHTTPAVPYDSSASPEVFRHSEVFFEKLVSSPYYPTNALEDDSEPLKCGEPGGAKVLAEILTTRVCLRNSRLRWVTIESEGTSRQFLAYSLVDGNGPGGPHKAKSGDARSTPFLRPLNCRVHDPRLGRFSALLLPTPLSRAPSFALYARFQTDTSPHEDWCLDDWFPAQKDACWVIREAEDSKPLQESFLLMPASEESDRPVFFIALFAETEPKRLVKELAALYKVSPDTALNSPETMQRLNSLYEKVRDFPLGK